MNILFLTLAYPTDEKENNLYTDLMGEFVRNDHTVHVVCQREKRFEKETEWTFHNNIPVLRVKTGNVTKTNIFEKGIATIKLENQFMNAINRYNQFDKIDLIIYSTPPITFSKVIKKLKKKFNSKTYLLLKDIFPQNAIDLEMFKENGLVSKFFKLKEKKLYNISDYIGCMSEGNKQFILKQNNYLTINKVEVNPNSIVPTQSFPLVNKAQLKKKYQINPNQMLFVYGGNLGKPQGIDYLLVTLKVLREHQDIFVMIIGDGTEFKKIEAFIKLENLKNVKLLKTLPKVEYEKIVQIADVGLIYLDKRFTIPNIPSRLLSYMDKSVPVLAITDNNTDLKDIIKKANCGFFSPAGNAEHFNRIILNIKSKKGNLSEKGINGRVYLEENFNVKNSYEIIKNHFEGEPYD